MCTTARMTYQLTYRALRAFASGRKSTNPIVEMEKMEACVPYSICSHTHDVMMKANRSFNQKVQKPSLVHEPIDYKPGKVCNHRIEIMGCGISTLRGTAIETINGMLHTAQLRAYARKLTYRNIHMEKLDRAARAIKATQDLPLFV